MSLRSKNCVKQLSRALHNSLTEQVKAHADIDVPNI